MMPNEASTPPHGPLTVAGLQLDLAWEDPDANFQRAAHWAERAAAAGARLVALPEMFSTGFSMRSREIAPHGERTRRFLGDLAKRLGLWVLGGYAEPGPDGDGRPRNACSLLSPRGEETLRYHKIHPFGLAGEDEHYEGGEALPTAEVEGVRLTPLICYDLRFPEPFRAAAGRTDLFVVIANWPAARVHAWSTLLAARAIECQAFVLGVNRVGEGDGLRYTGRTSLLDPLGETIATARDQEAIVAGQVDSQRVAEIRRQLPFLEDRRPEVYGKL